jgi:hypothetical protein
VDLACGTARFLSSHGVIETGRFLGSHILSFRGLRESLSDALTAIGALRLWKPIFLTILSPKTVWRWIANLVKKAPEPGPEFRIILRLADKNVSLEDMPWPLGSLLKRLSPALQGALELVYANDNHPARNKIAAAISFLLRGLRLTDLVILPIYGTLLFLSSVATAISDAFRFYVLKTPVEKMLAEPVMAHAETGDQHLPRQRGLAHQNALARSHRRPARPFSGGAVVALPGAGLCVRCPAFCREGKSHREFRKLHQV